MFRATIIFALLLICAPVVLLFWMDHSTPSPSEIALLEKLTPDVATTTEGEEQYLSAENRTYKSFGIYILHSIKPATNQFFRRIDWKGKQYWLNAEQYKPHLYARRTDVFLLVLSALGPLLLFAIAYIQSKEDLPKGASEAIAFIVACTFMTVLKPGWWFLHPLWMMSVIILWISVSLFTIVLIRTFIRNIRREPSVQPAVVYADSLSSFPSEFGRQMAEWQRAADEKESRWPERQQQRRRNKRKERRRMHRKQ